MTVVELKSEIAALWSRRGSLGPGSVAEAEVVRAAVGLLDSGEARVAEVAPDGDVVVNEWLKLAVLLLFKVSAIEVTELGPFEYADRLPLKHGFEEAGVRVVPGASARWGSFIGRGAVMMPSYVNIGAHVGAGTMVDTWATVGSCAQVGEGVGVEDALPTDVAVGEHPGRLERGVLHHPGGGHVGGGVPCSGRGWAPSRPRPTWPT